MSGSGPIATRRPLRALASAGCLLVLLLLYEPTQTDWIQRGVLPAAAALLTWLLTGSTLVTWLGIGMLAGAHATPFGADPYRAWWLPGLALLAFGLLGFELADRFRRQMAASTTERRHQRALRAGTATMRLVRHGDVTPLLDLRARVLRPGQPPESARFDGDDDPHTLHLALHEDGIDRPVAIVSLYPRPSPHTVATPVWQLRSMATDPGRRGAGLGTRLLDAALDQLSARCHRDAQRGLVWCNARLAAATLYARAGFEPRGDDFDQPGIGPHRHMERAIEPNPAMTLNRSQVLQPGEDLALP